MSDHYFYDMEKGWPKLLQRVMTCGRDVRPRGLRTLELENVSFTLLDPSKAVVANPQRALNHAFSAVEFLWVISGQDEVETLAFFNSRMRDFADQPTHHADGTETPNARLFGAYGPPVVAQLPYVVRSLRDDPDSRQAVVTIWRQNPPKTKDVPCTVMLQFLLRSEFEGAPRRLNMLTVMRSNDLWLGTPYDVPLFCRVQAYVASLLGVPVGTYTHLAGSMHVYSNNFDAVEKIGYYADAERPRNLVVGALDPNTDPARVWAEVESAVRQPNPAPPSGLRIADYGEGWNDLLRLALDYAGRKRARGRAEVFRG